jgi:hypothetical protein
LGSTRISGSIIPTARRYSPRSAATHQEQGDVRNQYPSHNLSRAVSAKFGMGCPSTQSFGTFIEGISARNITSNCFGDPTGRNTPLRSCVGFNVLLRASNRLNLLSILFSGIDGPSSEFSSLPACPCAAVRAASPRWPQCAAPRRASAIWPLIAAPAPPRNRNWTLALSFAITPAKSSRMFDCGQNQMPSPFVQYGERTSIGSSKWLRFYFGVLIRVFVFRLTC